MLNFIGKQRLGRTYYPHFMCDKCGTTYPVINGVISCNGKHLRHCMCEWEDKPLRAARRLWRRPSRNARTSFTIGERKWRISITDDGILNVSYYEPTDEGHDFFSMLVDFDLGLASITGGGRDCDGPISTTTELQWVSDRGVWSETHSEVDDAFAQAMNY